MTGKTGGWMCVLAAFATLSLTAQTPPPALTGRVFDTAQLPVAGGGVFLRDTGSRRRLAATFDRPGYGRTFRVSMGYSFAPEGR